jgi:hypothetical protein
MIMIYKTWSKDIYWQRLDWIKLARNKDRERPVVKKTREETRQLVAQGGLCCMVLISSITKLVILLINKESKV